VAPRSKLCLIVRADLSPGLQASQAVHAAQAFQATHPALCAAWMADSNTLAILAVPDVAALQRTLERAQDAGVPHAAFRDDDLTVPLTAIALAPAAATRRICRDLDLALS